MREGFRPKEKVPSRIAARTPDTPAETAPPALPPVRLPAPRGAHASLRVARRGAFALRVRGIEHPFRDRFGLLEPRPVHEQPDAVLPDLTAVARRLVPPPPPAPHGDAGDRRLGPLPPVVHEQDIVDVGAVLAPALVGRPPRRLVE